MAELSLTGHRAQLCAAYGRALTDRAFRELLGRQPERAMAQFGFTLGKPTAAAAWQAWPSKWYVPDDLPPPPI